MVKIRPPTTFRDQPKIFASKTTTIAATKNCSQGMATARRRSLERLTCRNRVGISTRIKAGSEIQSTTRLRGRTSEGLSRVPLRTRFPPSKHIKIMTRLATHQQYQKARLLPRVRLTKKPKSKKRLQIFNRLAKRMCSRQWNINLKV